MIGLSSKRWKHWTRRKHFPFSPKAIGKWGTRNLWCGNRNLPTYRTTFPGKVALRGALALVRCVKRIGIQRTPLKTMAPTGRWDRIVSRHRGHPLKHVVSFSSRSSRPSLLTKATRKVARLRRPIAPLTPSTPRNYDAFRVLKYRNRTRTTIWLEWLREKWNWTPLLGRRNCCEKKSFPRSLPTIKGDGGCAHLAIWPANGEEVAPEEIVGASSAEN